MLFPVRVKHISNYSKLFKAMLICILGAVMVFSNKLKSTATEQTSPGSTWTGNGPYGGAVHDLAMAAFPDVLFAAAGGGVYKTNDGGLNWFKTSHPAVTSYAVAIAPSDGSIIYSSAREGVYKSENGGDSWQLKPISSITPTALSVDPRDPGVVYEASRQGVYKSGNGGDSWELILDMRAMDVLLDSKDPDYIYVALEWESDGLARSLNGGDSWEFIHVSSDDWNSEDVYALAMTPSWYNPAAIYAYSTSLYYDVYKSMDGGSTWSPTNTPEWWMLNSPVALGIDPGDPNIVYIGADDYFGQLLRSNNGGGSWTPIQNGLPEGNPTAFAIHSSNHSLLLSMEEGGIYRSSDQGDSWMMASEGLCNTTINHVAVHPQDSRTAIAALHGSGHYLAKTTDGGASWNYMTSSPPDPYNNETPAEIGAVAYDPLNPQKIYAGDGLNYVYELFVYKSSDGGQTWDDHKFLEFTNFSEYNGVSDIWVHPDGYSVLVAVEGWGGFDGGGGIYRGTSSLIKLEREFTQWTNALAGDPNAPDTVYAGTERCGYVYRSENGGQTWGNISPPPGDDDCWVWQVRDLTVDASSHVFAATSSGLWKFDGVSWIDYPSLPNMDLTGVAIDGGKLYVTTAEDGVYLSMDGGASWMPEDDGLLDLAMDGLYLGKGSASILYAGTEYGGVWVKSSGVVVLPERVYMPIILSGGQQ